MGVFLLTVYKEKLRGKPILSLFPACYFVLDYDFVVTVDNIYIVRNTFVWDHSDNSLWSEFSGIAYNKYLWRNIKRTMLAFGDYVQTKHTPFYLRADLCESA